mmetsp:Transcript_2792/g.5138  ORF Transcript_2792/g.5138 Transcript_2792/m.5138 type:complete len:205 (-) Transcript_2792:336-950(-)
MQNRGGLEEPPEQLFPHQGRPSPQHEVPRPPGGDELVEAHLRQEQEEQAQRRDRLCREGQAGPRRGGADASCLPHEGRPAVYRELEYQGRPTHPEAVEQRRALSSVGRMQLRPVRVQQRQGQLLRLPVQVYRRHRQGKLPGGGRPQLRGRPPDSERAGEGPTSREEVAPKLRKLQRQRCDGEQGRRGLRPGQGPARRQPPTRPS